MPSSLAVRPLLIPAARKYACSDATRTSHAVARQKPPPMAAPFTAAITGWCIRRTPRITSSSSSRARRAMVVRVSPSMRGRRPGFSRSAPEQNPSPAPVSTTTRTSLSWLTSSSASFNGIITSKAMAFMRSGRFRVISATCGRGVSMRTKGTSYVMPVAHPLDEYPIHQVPLSMRHVATSDRNAYDRCIFQAHDRTGDVLLITGLGVYPNLGVIDAFATVRRGDRQVAVRTSDAMPDNRMEQRVGPFRIEVVEPLRAVRLVWAGSAPGSPFARPWPSSFRAAREPQQIQRSGDKPRLEGCRFVPAGSWSGRLGVEGDELAVTD